MLGCIEAVRIAYGAAIRFDVIVTVGSVCLSPLRFGYLEDCHT